MTTFAACLIVKDEEDNIVRCLNSVKDIISSYTIIDTGSTDATKKLIEEALTPKAGRLLDSTFTNFRDNRSELMREAKGSADWLILLDADMVFHYDGDLQSLPQGYDAFAGRIGDTTLDYKLPLIVKGDKEWRYEGVAHSYLACEPSEYTQHTLPGLWVEDHSRTGPGKLDMDLRLLSEEHARNPTDARTVFYLAQTHADLDHIDEAIHFYRMRTFMGGWEEETYVARQRLGTLLSENVSFALGARVLLEAWELRPNRAETLRILARVADNVADKIPYPDDLLFVLGHAYRKHGVGITPDKVSDDIVTRGNQPESVEDNVATMKKAGIEDVVVWDNSKRDDMKTYGRYLAEEECVNDVIVTMDDDVILTVDIWNRLLAEYEPGINVVNMDSSWSSVYKHDIGLGACGGIYDKGLYKPWVEKYLSEHPFDDEFLLESDFVFGALVPFRIVDLGYDVRPFADDPDRLYTQPGQTEKKHRIIAQAKALA